MKVRALAVGGALISAMALGIGSGGTAYAQDGPSQYCSSGYCLNGWNGGPYVNAYTMNQANDDFQVMANPGAPQYVNIVFDGFGDTGQCVSDYGNSSTDARAGLYGQCQRGQIAWGANFQLIACNNGETWAFKNVHWGGWLTPNSHSDGSPFYLNSATKTCYQVSPGV